ncbi:Carbonic anhydrase precursor [Listeria grayi]|uniref:carbonic anhydrase n=1 Tax=Listeria grayi FSL F6-1183 TaxID=1265827 RepID=A0A829RA78_LISGR|nr:carbonic anhydrase family protein [Listeria grayi]EUJ29320.1 putative carbonic anhydrase [Listeria grayi FSL F6-1183]MBC1922204.1 carbonic anhydrase [Listeria grayi]VEI32401.1 Carbonic anhydrase precursor [Listeria grayi]
MNQVTWDYHGERGPEMWGHLCPEFEIADTGREQSPIDIQQDQLQKITKEPLAFHYIKDTFTIKRIENSVHAFPTDQTQGVTYKGTFYKLFAFHAHIPSEHLLNGKEKPIEWHFVHENENQEKLVIGVWMEFGEAMNAVLQELAEDFNKVFPDFEQQRTIQLSVEDFLPKERAYYHYMGSLTTPPTLENLTWIVLKEPATITPADHATFEKIIGGTVRPVQPLHGRTVVESE